MSRHHRSWLDSEGAIEIFRALGRVWGPDRHGVVDGVEFDFRHPLLDPKEWRCGAFAADPLGRRGTNMPFLWFPWFGAFDAEALRASVMADKNLKGGNRKKDAEFAIWALTPEHFVNRGDKVAIDRVERIFLGDQFAHKHDREAYAAFLAIKSRDGSQVQVETPLIFTGYDAMFSLSLMTQYFEAICRRICRFYSINSICSLKEFLSIPEDNSYAYSALVRAGVIEKLTRSMRRLADNPRPSEKQMEASKTLHLVNDAVALGYLWAKAEDGIGMQPLAEATLRVKDGGVMGGRQSGAARREKRAQTWEPHARELAGVIRADDPTLSQDRVAEEICLRWKAAEFSPPGHKTLKQLISHMEKEGDLPRRARNGKERAFR